jgi:hypothetical protein
MHGTGVPLRAAELDNTYSMPPRRPRRGVAALETVGEDLERIVGAVAVVVWPRAEVPAVVEDEERRRRERRRLTVRVLPDPPVIGRAMRSASDARARLDDERVVMGPEGEAR